MPNSKSDTTGSACLLVKWDGPTPPTEQEAEARLRQEGYECYRWYDVAGASYPKHRHGFDECLWVISGSISFVVDGQEYALSPGDRLYLPKRLAHTAQVPKVGGVTYLVGQKNSGSHKC